MNRQDQLGSIVATTDVHSALEQAMPMLLGLGQARGRALVVDCGDFFHGPGYRVTQGRVEEEVLCALYDVVAVGNHGYDHHLRRPLRDLTVCANLVDSGTGALLFSDLRVFNIAGHTVAVTAVIGDGAFRSVPPEQRLGHRWVDPAQALNRVYAAHRHEVRSWVLLSHSGFAADLDLVPELPFLDIVFAGHCHSDSYGPQRAGRALVVKGPEQGQGFAEATWTGGGWAATSGRFPTNKGSLPPHLAGLAAAVEQALAQMRRPVGLVASHWQGAALTAASVAAAVAKAVSAGTASATVVNESAFQPTPLGAELLLGDVARLVPYGNQLVEVDCTPSEVAGLIESARSCTPCAVHIPPSGRKFGRLVVTDYVATRLNREGRPTALDFVELVGRVLQS